jgi:hypothetical protein
MGMSDKWSTDGPICPSCGYLHKPDDGHFYNESGFDMNCGECDYLFTVLPYCSWSWTTRSDKVRS